MPMSEVSLAVGFADQSIFTRAFTRWYGKTPHAYRLDDALGPT
jgi:AraC-like DNA-binding protein